MRTAVTDFAHGEKIRRDSGYQREIKVEDRTYTLRRNIQNQRLYCVNCEMEISPGYVTASNPKCPYCGQMFMIVDRFQSTPAFLIPLHQKFDKPIFRRNKDIELERKERMSKCVDGFEWKKKMMTTTCMACGAKRQHVGGVRCVACGVSWQKRDKNGNIPADHLAEYKMNSEGRKVLKAFKKGAK